MRGNYRLLAVFLSSFTLLFLSSVFIPRLVVTACNSLNRLSIHQLHQSNRRLGPCLCPSLFCDDRFLIDAGLASWFLFRVQFVTDRQNCKSPTGNKSNAHTRANLLTSQRPNVPTSIPRHPETETLTHGPLPPGWVVELLEDGKMGPLASSGRRSSIPVFCPLDILYLVLSLQHRSSLSFLSMQ